MLACSTMDPKQQQYLDTLLKGCTPDVKVMNNIEFSGCVFQDCDFTAVSFRGCQFRACQFKRCNLSVLQISDSVFIDVQFSRCKMLGINWTQARKTRLSAGAPYAFADCIINDSSFQGLQLSGLQLHNCRAHDVDFREADLRGAQCHGSDFSNSLFLHSDLRKADFSQARNYHIDIRHNQVSDAIFDQVEALSLLQALDIKIVNAGFPSD